MSDRRPEHARYPRRPMNDLLALLWQTDDDLRDDAIVRAIVRPEVAIGPVTLGATTRALRDAIDRGPRDARGFPLLIGDEHWSTVGTATGTTANHVIHQERPNRRLAWFEWAADERTDRLVVARFVVGHTDHAGDGLLRALRAALDAALGPGVERRAKHRRALCRPVDWTRDTATLTLGAAAMGGGHWHSHTAVVLEAFDTAWPDTTARWTMFR